MDYKISIDRVVDMFLSLAGSDSTDDSYIFCHTAAQSLQSRLNPKADLFSRDFDICYAAACTAYYRFILKSKGDCMNAKLGDITINDTSENTVKFAARLYDEANNAISDLLRPKRFAFKGV